MPAIAVSAWIPAQTVVTSEYRHTSVIATLRRRWQLGDPLTGRDAVAASLEPVLAGAVARDPQDWPQVTPRPVPPFPGVIPAPDAAMRGLARAGLLACLELAAHRGRTGLRLSTDEDISRANGIALLDEVSGGVFTRLRGR